MPGSPWGAAHANAPRNAACVVMAQGAHHEWRVRNVRVSMAAHREGGRGVLVGRVGVSVTAGGLSGVGVLGGLVCHHHTPPVAAYRMTLPRPPEGVAAAGRARDYRTCTTTVDAIRHIGAASEDHTTGADTGPA